MKELTPHQLLALYWQRAHEPRPVHAAIPKAAKGDPAQMLMWSVGAEDLSRRLSLLPSPDSYDTVTLQPPERRTQ